MFVEDMVIHGFLVQVTAHLSIMPTLELKIITY